MMVMNAMMVMIAIMVIFKKKYNLKKKILNLGPLWGFCFTAGESKHFKPHVYVN